jgi:hypothetical protein
MSTLGTDATWVNIGTAKQLWNKTATNCTNAQKETIKKHMDKAEKIALTISL